MSEPKNLWTRLNLIRVYDSDFQAAARKYNLDWKWLKAIAMIESWIGTYRGVVDTDDERRLAPNAPDSSDKLSAGIMQVTRTTARDYLPNADWRDLQNPRISIDIAARHLAMLRRLYSGPRQLEFIIKSYNQGQGNTLREFQSNLSGIKYLQAHNYWLKFQEALKAVE